MSYPSAAGFKRRFASLLIDFLIILLVALIILGISLLIYNNILGYIPSFSELGSNLISLTLIVPIVLYSVISEYGKCKGTFGKRRMRISVASNRGKINLWQIIIRNLIKFLPWQTAHMMIFNGIAHNWDVNYIFILLISITYILPLIGICFICFRKDHRGLHDLVANTIVVDKYDII